MRIWLGLLVALALVATAVACESHGRHSDGNTDADPDAGAEGDADPDGAAGGDVETDTGTDVTRDTGGDVGRPGAPRECVTSGDCAIAVDYGDCCRCLALSRRHIDAEVCVTYAGEERPPDCMTMCIPCIGCLPASPGMILDVKCVAGACDLVERPCAPGECEQPATCASDRDCAMARVCVDGICTPGCRSDTDCAGPCVCTFDSEENLGTCACPL